MRGQPLENDRSSLIVFNSRTEKNKFDICRKIVKKNIIFLLLTASNLMT